MEETQHGSQEVPEWDKEWKPDDYETVVLFRMWSPQIVTDRGVEGREKPEIIAVFPEIPASCTNWYECESYQPNGQHAACNYQRAILPYSRPATPEEYAACKKELESYPYGYKLVVRLRETSGMRWKREREFRKMMEYTPEDE